ncbi:M15 family metallopeptidase [Fusibacter bizertensis]
MKTITLLEKSIYSGDLILVNGKHPYHPEFSESTPVSVRVDCDSILLDRKVTVLLSNLMAEIDGWREITAVSGWRSIQEQQELYDQSILENGIDFTVQFVAKPNHSEHHTGLAIDLGLKKTNIDFIRPDFPYSGICQTFRDKAIHYGFIERYPKGKKAVTGIAHEPWHFRYIGAPHAAIINKQGLTLEEYHDFLKQFIYGKNYFTYQVGRQIIAVSYIEATTKEKLTIEIEDDVPYSISGNNMDGFILTEWRKSP